MIHPRRKLIALVVAFVFLSVATVGSMPAAGAAAGDEPAAGNAGPGRNFVEKEQQAGYQSAGQKHVVPVLIGIAALAAAVFVVVLLVNKIKYDITGQWEFHNHYTSGGLADFDSTWQFVSADTLIKTIGTYVRYEDNGSVMTGDYTIVNKKEVVFIGAAGEEQYTGQFDSKTTMSGQFMLEDGTKGTWTAKKK